MYDQAGMIREMVKWDYELRNAEQLTMVVDRALTIAATEPRGPVYLSLPREVIAAPLADLEHPSPSRLKRRGSPGAGRRRDCGGRAHARAGNAAADRDGERWQGRGGLQGADAVYRTVCDPGRAASAALSLAAVIASHESRFRPRARGANGGCYSGARERRPLDPKPGRASVGLQG